MIHRNTRIFEVLSFQFVRIPSLSQYTNKVVGSSRSNIALSIKRTSTLSTSSRETSIRSSKNIVNSIKNNNMSTDTVSPIIPSIPNNAKRIFWIRHGEVINPGGNKDVYYGAQDVELSELGKLEAKEAGIYLQQYQLSNVYSSTLSRAIYGAEQVIQYQKTNNNNQLQLVQLVGLKELDRGEWCGKTLEEVGVNNMKRFDELDETITPIGGESYRVVNERVMDSRNNYVLSSMTFGTCSAIVSHLQVTRCIMADALHIPMEQMVQKVKIATASITCIDYVYDNIDNTSPVLSKQIVHFQSFKPAHLIGLKSSKDFAN